MAKGNINIQMTGDRALIRKLRKFPLAVQKKVVLPETRASVYRLKDHLLRNLSGLKVNIHTGAWYRAVDRQRPWALKRSRVRVGHGLNLPTRMELGIPYNDSSFYPFAVEYGTKERVPGGVSPAFRVMRDAVDDHYNEEIRMIARGFHAGVQKQWKKAS